MLNLVIATDIFGRCEALQRFITDVERAGATVIIVDPYQSEHQPAMSEQQAYTNYVAQCGHDMYTERVSKALHAKVTLAIGFSAGATALWRAMAKTKNASVRKLVLFYPGQLHLHLAKTPEVPTELIFGAQEYHFDVDEVLVKLQSKTGISARKVAQQHGFMNSASLAFNERAYQDGLNRVLQVIANL